MSKDDKLFIISIIAVSLIWIGLHALGGQAKDHREVIVPQQQMILSTKVAIPEVIEIDISDTYTYVGKLFLTSYCPCSKCCGHCTGITASGTKATAGRTIAADTNRFPFGTQLMINGVIYTVEDTGGAIKQDKLDVYYNTHSEALKGLYGWHDVYVVERRVTDGR